MTEEGNNIFIDIRIHVPELLEGFYFINNERIFLFEIGSLHRLVEIIREQLYRFMFYTVQTRSPVFEVTIELIPFQKLKQMLFLFTDSAKIILYNEFRYRVNMAL